MYRKHPYLLNVINLSKITISDIFVSGLNTKVSGIVYILLYSMNSFLCLNISDIYHLPLYDNCSENIFEIQ